MLGCFQRELCLEREGFFVLVMWICNCFERVMSVDLKFVIYDFKIELFLIEC